MTYVDHANRHKPGGTDHADGGIYPIKVFGDDQALVVGDGAFVFYVTAADHLDGTKLMQVGAYVTTVSSSGAPTVQLRRVGGSNMLSTAVTIDAGDEVSDDATTAAVIDTSNDDVSTGDGIAIDIDAAGTDAMGLGVILVFG